MSLLLCRQEHVKYPFYMEELGIHIHSSQELSYVIYNHPLLVMDGLIDERFLEFLTDELDMEFLAVKLEKWMKGGESSDELLVLILTECYYYHPHEIGRYRQKLSGFRKLHPADFSKAKADNLFSLKQYGRAIKRYESLLQFSKDQFVDDFYLGRIWNNLGTCYSRIFRFEKALECFKMAYELTKEYTIVRTMYLLTLLEPQLHLESRYCSMIDEEISEQWSQQYGEAFEEAEQSDEVKELEALFGRDPIRRLSGTGELVQRWKQDYRNMI